MDQVAFLFGRWFFNPKGYVGKFKEFVAAGSATGAVLPCAVSCRPFQAISRGNPKAVRYFRATGFALLAHFQQAANCIAIRHVSFSRSGTNSYIRLGSSSQIQRDKLPSRERSRRKNAKMSPRQSPLTQVNPASQNIKNNV